MTPRLQLVLLLLALASTPANSQTPSSPVDLGTTIGRLASLEYPTRMNAARTIRRVPPEQAVPALVRTVRAHEDEFVRYRAFVLLTTFNDRGTPELVRWALGDRNDRLREVAYKWLERHPDPQMTPTLLGALQTEQAEFVRPALVGALAALGKDPQVQRALIAETSRGLDFFRSAVVDALGHHRATYAVDAIAAVAKLDGPLQDDALLALGRIGERRALAVVRATSSTSPDVMLAVRGAHCLLGEDCAAQIKALADAATAGAAASGVIRAATDTLAAVAGAGHDAALTVLLNLARHDGVTREHAAAGFATAAVRRPEQVIAWMDTLAEPERGTAVDLLKDGFDILDEDFAEEQFFATARAMYWSLGEGSPTRVLVATLIQRLEF